MRITGELHSINSDGAKCYCAEGIGGQMLVDAGIAKWIESDKGCLALIPADRGEKEYTPADLNSAATAFDGWVWGAFGLTGGEAMPRPRGYTAIYATVEHVWTFNDAKTNDGFTYSWAEIAQVLKEVAEEKA